MRTVQAHGSTQLQRERTSPACLACGTRAGCCSGFLAISPSIFLEPFAPPALPGFLATMTPLTPARRLSGGRQVSLLHLLELPTIPSPTTPSSPVIALTRYPSAPQVSKFWFRLHRRSSRSPNDQAESSSLLLRTGHSRPGAFHPVSRRRSTIQLQAGERLPEKDFHLSVQTNSQTHRASGVSRMVVSGYQTTLSLGCFLRLFVYLCSDAF